jgi:hypothetical protein
MVIYIWGALTMACAVTALLFLRFWKVSRERLFLFFALAFAVFGLNWGSLGLLDPVAETRHYFYVLRLIAFLLIIVGVVDKNRRGAATRPRPGVAASTLEERP